MKAGKTILSLVLTAVLLSTLLPVTASAAVSTTYVDVNGVTQTVNATQITADTTTLSAGWYVANSNITRNKVTTVSGSVNLILADGVNVGASDAVLDTGIMVSGGNSLTIYGQVQGTGSLYIRGGPDSAAIGGKENSTVGTITINGGTINSGGWYGSAIGGAAGSTGGTIIINGGTIEARGGIDCAGIGSGLSSGGGSITINGGNITATGGTNGSGIGGGKSGSGWNVTINNGTVSATGKSGPGSGGGAGIGGSQSCGGGTIVINGGTVNASGAFNGAAIGGGSNASGGAITINGGHVTAYASICSAGIGSGVYGSGGTITITGGVVNAYGASCGAGIGGGAAGAGGTIRITGGTVTAIGGSGTYQVLSGGHIVEDGGGPGIGSGAIFNGIVPVSSNVTIEGGTITATGGDGGYINGGDALSYIGGGAGIGGGQYAGGGTISITGGTVTATGKAGGTGVGGGEDGNGGTINISGGTVIATGSESSPGIGGGQLNRKGTASNGGAVTVSGGVVMAAAGPGTSMDIGPGAGGSGGSLTISSTAAVFLRNDGCTAPTVSTNHTHLTSVGESMTPEGAYGIQLPSWGKAANIGAYLRLISTTYHVNQEGFPAEAHTVSQHIGTTGLILGVAGAMLNGYTLVSWNTAAGGSGISYTPQAPYNFNTPLTLYGQWVVSEYTVTWQTQDGSTTLEQDNTVLHGSAPGFNAADPSKADTAQYDYEFVGWAASANQTTGTPENNLPAILGNTTYYAAFSQTLRTYAVTWKSQDGNTMLETDNAALFGSAPGFDAADPTKTDTAQYHYAFAGWATSANQTAGTLEGSLPAVPGNTTYYAVFSETLRNYTVAFNSNGGSAVSSQSISYNNTAAQPPTPTKVGHIFAGWYTNIGLTSTYSFTTAITANIILYAKWTANIYTVTFNSNAGSVVEGQSVNYNNTATEPATPTKVGHSFAGWYTNSGLTSAYSFTTAVTTNITLYAKWTGNTYNVTFDSNGGSAVESQYIIYNNTADEPTAPTKAGHTFAGWYTDSGLTSAYNFTAAITGNITLYALWTVNTYTVTFNSNAGSAVESQYIIYNNTADEPTAPTKAGHTFAGWYTNIGLTSANSFTTAVTTNITLYAKWMVNIYNVTFNSNGGSAVESQNIIYNNSATQPDAPTKAGHTFAEWYTDSGLTSAYNFTAAITGNITLYALWTVNTYTVTFNSNAGSAVESQYIIYNNTAAEPAAPTKAGHTFAGWYTNIGLTSANSFTTAVTTNITLYAKWMVNIYNVTFNSDGGSAVESQNIIYNNGATQPTAPTKVGHTFAGWYTDSELIAAYSFINRITENITLYARWTVNTYTVTYYDNYDSEQAYTVQANIPYGSTLTAPVTNPARRDYAFSGWYKEAGCDNEWDFGIDTVVGAFGLYTKWTAKTPVLISEAVQTFIYNGSAKDFKISGIPVADFAVTYNQGSGDISPVHSGTYNVVLIRAEDATYASYSKTITGGLVINPAAKTYNANVKAGNSPEKTLPVTINIDTGTASIVTGAQNLTSGGTVIAIPSIPGVDTFSVGIPVTDLSTSDRQGVLTLDTDTGSVTIPSNMLNGVSNINGSRAEITIGQGDKSNLPDNVMGAIGDRPLVQLTLSIDGKQTDWSNSDAPINVRIPYTPTTAELENPESIVVWYIDGSGDTVTVSNGRYDSLTGTVTFQTTHFSNYAVAYNAVRFNDVAPGKWYKSAVSFIAARGITGGTAGGNYSPDVKLTRGEFIVLMMRAYGIAPDKNPTDNFADAGSTYYTGYLAAAKRLGISSGVGNSMFAPGKEITRQEMFTLLYNALKVLEQLPDGPSGKTLSDFSDTGDIAYWAKDAMTLMASTGIVTGNGGKLSPTVTTTRAEIAQVLYNLLTQ